MAYKILIKHNSDKKNNLCQSYGNSITTTSASSTTTTFTEFSTEDIEVLKTEIQKIIAERGNSEIRIVKDVEITYGVDVVDDEEATTDPDNTTGDDTSTTP